MINLHIANSQTKINTSATLICNPNADFNQLGFSKEEIKSLELFKNNKRLLIPLLTGDSVLFVQYPETRTERYRQLEAARMAGANLANSLKELTATKVELRTDADAEILLAYAEGLALGNYRFEKYKKDKASYKLEDIYLNHPDMDEEKIKELQILIEANFFSRDLVNEPGGILTAERLSEVIVETGKKVGFKTEVFNKAKITSLKMGGLLGVNAGSQDPPTFNILEYKPENAVNSKPIVFVGKGVVFDTGGLTLKPTPNSMDQMKSDMAGAAAVAGLFYAIAKAKLPIHVVGLIPATDNRPGENAIYPGDILTIIDGTTVEVLNTDAEGRLILADALAYAKKYDPQLVIDLATLTGAAARAIGPFGIVYLGTADENIKKNLEQSGRNTYERLVELPLWEEYDELLKSDIADVKNVAAGGSAGAITAGKFLQRFTNYPWIHLDIATMAFLSSSDSYRGRNATGVGVRLLFDFIKNVVHHE